MTDNIEKTKATEGIIKFTNLAKGYVHWLCNVTGNCQLSCFGYFSQMMTAGWSKDAIESVFTQITDLGKITDKRLLLFDIKNVYKDRFDNMIEPSQIQLTSSYISTNGSTMYLILVRINNGRWWK